MQCQECRRDFPAALIQELVASDLPAPRAMCPLCAYEKYMNPLLGMPPDAPPDRRRAPMAYQLWDAARRHVAQQKKI